MSCTHFGRLAMPMLALIALAGCATTIPKSALQLTPESLQNRQLQTRRFATTDESAMLSACAGVLQDLGYNIDESESKIGVVVASKQREAVSAGQVTGAIVVAALTGAVMPVDKAQTIRASLVTHPILSEQAAEAGKPVIGMPTSEMAVRVTFQRVIMNTQNQITKAEQINDPEVYQGFFEKLSQAVFLEGQGI
jgi:hypothetical protein